MPQFYNWALGVNGIGGGQMSAAKLFWSLSNDLSESELNKMSF